MSYVYIISCQRDNGKLPEIYSMWSTYEKAVNAYYDVCVEDIKELESIALSTKRDSKLTELGID